eukprot:16445585-Heterocapsa_arctica.AAC.1
MRPEELTKLNLEAATERLSKLYTGLRTRAKLSTDIRKGRFTDHTMVQGPSLRYPWSTEPRRFTYHRQS